MKGDCRAFLGFLVSEGFFPECWSGWDHTQRHKWTATIRGSAYSTNILLSLDPQVRLIAGRCMPFMGEPSTDISKGGVSQEHPGSSLFLPILYFRKSHLNIVFVPE